MFLSLMLQKCLQNTSITKENALEEDATTECSRVVCKETTLMCVFFQSIDEYFYKETKNCFYASIKDAAKNVEQLMALIINCHLHMAKSVHTLFHYVESVLGRFSAIDCQNVPADV